MIKPKKTLCDITPYKTDKLRKSWRLKLDSNENIYGCSNAVINTLKNIRQEDISLYPCYGELISKLASVYDINEENILLTNGCDEALNIIINTYIEENDGFLSYTPSFSMPVLYAKIAGAEISLIEYDEKFVFDIEKVRKNIKNSTKIVYIASPNNPTGETVSSGTIKNLAKEFKDVLFLIDATYINFAKNIAFEDYADLTKEYDNIAVIKSFSKDFALAGLRLGFIVSNKINIENLKKISSPYNVNAVALNCAMRVLSDDKEFERIKTLNEQARDELFSVLQSHGFKPYKSEGNFILCDFLDYCDFYYEKLKKNGVIVRNFSKNSPVATCLRITVPKLSGIKYISSLLDKKDMLIFDIDGVIFDVRESYFSAIKETYKYFSKKDITDEEINKVKSMGNMNCDWDATKYLLETNGFEVDIDDIIDVFQNLFYNPEIKKDNYLIDKEKLLISKETFEELSSRYDLVIFSGRYKYEALYSLEKFGIDKYFYYFQTSDGLAKELTKPNPWGVLEILKHCPHLTIKYFGDSVDDIIAGNGAKVDTIGVLSPGCDYNVMTNNFKHLGAKYMIEDIKNIKNFLGEIEKDYAESL